MDDDFKYTEEDLKNIRKYGCSCRFDFPFVIHLAKRYNVKNFDVDFAELYGVLPGESDFSGAIERLKDKEECQLTHLDKEYLEVKQWMDERRKSKDPEVRKNLKEKINNYFDTHKEGYEAFHKNSYLQNEINQLILEYNKRMKDDINYPDKDKVRLWYSYQAQMLINAGAFSYSFLYPDFIGSIEDLEKILKK